ncbi:MAG: BlaI/MecI/CopY family transcriptional regulator [Acidobacteriota bacterium]
MAGSRSRDHELSRAELGLLKSFWRAGRLSAREVHDSFGVEMGWAYTTTRTMLDRMVKKGLLEREAFHGLFLYAAAVGKVSTVARLVREFTERVLELDRVPVATLFADSEMLDADELAELERLLADDGESPAESES